MAFEREFDLDLCLCSSGSIGLIVSCGSAGGIYAIAGRSALGLGWLMDRSFITGDPTGAVLAGPLSGGLGAGLLGTSPEGSFVNADVPSAGVDRGIGGGERGFSKLGAVGGNLGLDGGLIIGVMAV